MEISVVLIVAFLIAHCSAQWPGAQTGFSAPEREGSLPAPSDEKPLVPTPTFAWPPLKKNDEILPQHFPIPPVSLANKNVNLYDPPDFDYKSQSQPRLQISGPDEVYESRSFDLYCSVLGIPMTRSTRIVWGFESAHRNASMERLIQNRQLMTQMESGSSKLTAKTVTYDHSGTYSCKLIIDDTSVADAEKRVVVKTLSPPEIRSISDEAGMRKVEKAQGTSVTMICNATGGPAPRILWYKGNQEIGGEWHRIYLELEGQALTITRLSMRDEGEYSCVAYNSEGHYVANDPLILKVYKPFNWAAAGKLLAVMVSMIVIVALIITANTSSKWRETFDTKARINSIRESESKKKRRLEQGDGVTA